MMKLETGSVAPNFELPDEQTMPWVLSGHLGLGPVLLVFYRGDWCAYDNGQLAGLARNFDDFERRGVQVAGISVDPSPRNLEMFNKLSLTFPLLCDPQGDVARLYGLWDSCESLTSPAVVAVSQDGSIEEILTGEDFADRPDKDEISRVVKSLGRRSSGDSYRGGSQQVSVSVEDTESSVRAGHPAMSLGEMLTYFDGALLSSGLISSRLQAKRSSSRTLDEVARTENTLKTYREYLAETARLQGLEVFPR
ncbi:MAG: peroxiredoxin family protein [Rubrobacter sp.]